MLLRTIALLLILILLLVLLCACALRLALRLSKPLPCPGVVTRVVYEAYPGVIPDPFTERYTITLDEIRFERTGGDPVNRGVWTLAAPPGSIETLFETLGAVECRQIKRVLPEGWPDEAPLGGSVTTYRIEYEGGVFELRYGDGVWYEGAKVMTDPIRDFLRAIDFPEEAWGPYLEH